MHRRTLLVVLLLCLMIIPTVHAQDEVRVVVNRDNVNIRLYPALGATVLGSTNAETTFVVTGRSPDNEWLQIEFAGGEAWIGAVVVTTLEGDINQLPIRDPRSIPYGGADSPRAGFTDANSDIQARLPSSGVRVRSGPSTAYPIIADAPRYTIFPLLGRTANNAWVQVNFEGTLGWVKAQFIEIQDNRNILELPIDGVVATAPPLQFGQNEELFGILRIMRERLDLAQPSLDQQRRVWTDAAFGFTPFCGDYPSRPTNFNNVPREIRAQYFGTLEPLLIDFNEAMTNVRNAIDLQIETCNRPGGDVVLTSVPVVTGGLQMVSAADQQFASLRRRIDELLPEIGPDDCVFAFGGRVDILPFYPDYPEGEIIEGVFDPRELAIGFCFDADPLQLGRVEFIRDGSNYDAIIGVTSLDNPTNFLATADGGPSAEQSNVVIDQIIFPTEGRYLVFVAIQPALGEAPEGRYALLLTDISTGIPAGNILQFDNDGNIVRSELIAGGPTTGDGITTSATATNTQSVEINVYLTIDTNAGIVGTLAPGETVPAIGSVTGWVQVQLSTGVIGWVQSNQVDYTGATTDTGDTTDDGGSGGTGFQTACPGVSFSCFELLSCAEVQACVDAGSTALDSNGNGIACDAGEDPILACSVTVP